MEARARARGAARRRCPARGHGRVGGGARGQRAADGRPGPAPAAPAACARRPALVRDPRRGGAPRPLPRRATAGLACPGGALVRRAPHVPPGRGLRRVARRARAAGPRDGVGLSRGVRPGRRRPGRPPVRRRGPPRRAEPAPDAPEGRGHDRVRPASVPRRPRRGRRRRRCRAADDPPARPREGPRAARRDDRRPGRRARRPARADGARPGAAGARGRWPRRARVQARAQAPARARVRAQVRPWRPRGGPGSSPSPRRGPRPRRAGARDAGPGHACPVRPP